MSPVRELRYYASIPKLLFLLAVSTGFTAIGWSMVASSASFMAWAALIFFGICAVVGVLWLIITVVLRKPILRFTDAEVTFSQPLMPWRNDVIPWDNVASITIHARRGSRTTSYWLRVTARHPERYGSERSRLFVQRWFPQFEGVVISTLLSWLFLRVSQARRERMLEQIKTTFAPEIMYYGIAVEDYSANAKGRRKAPLGSLQ